MCGICGIVHADPTRVVDESELLAMRDAISARGPDDAGTYAASGVALGSRRLSILDLSPRGHMPMRTEDGRYHIAYNGEVYNAAELRRALEEKGVRFRSGTDTEVVLQLYAAEGPSALERLNGMFAFAIWDAVKRELFLARDRLGIKPLYYVNDGETLRFASEQKALFASGVRPSFDAATWRELLCFRYVAGEATPYEGVRRLLPGHFMLWRDGSVSLHRWWKLSERASSVEGLSRSALASWYRETFDDAVRLRRISDVPVGVLLSGGLDSGTVAASLAAQSGEGIHSFTVSFGDEGYDESPLARKVAEKWRLTYHETRLDGSELCQRLMRAIWLNDEPMVHGNELHIWAISEVAKRTVTVLLSGEGADETLGGYVRYRPLKHLGALRAASALLPRGFVASRTEGRIRKLARMLDLGSRDAFVLFNACDVLPVDIEPLGVDGEDDFAYRREMLSEAQAAHPGEPLRQAMYLDQHTFLCSLLDRNDRMTMGASIECRVPFLDYRIVERLAASPTAALFPDGRSKAVLRDALGDRLPPEVLAGKKWGFGVPWSTYFRTVPELRRIVEELPEARPVRDGPFDGRALRALTRRFLDGDVRTDAVVRQLAMIVIWHRACVESWMPASAPGAVALP
jgi:asparagine synthase (glutamine-hydrolysing)